MPPILGTTKTIWDFDPRSIPGCQLWLDAADKSTVVTSGSNVTQWNDKSGNGNNATIVTSTPPTYVSNAVVFTASNSTGIRGNISASFSNASVFIVASYISNSGSPMYLPRLFMLGSNNSTDNNLIGQFNNVDQGLPAAITYNGNGTGNAFGVGNYQTGGTISFSTPFLYTNVSTYSGTTFTNLTLVNGYAGTYATKTGTMATGGNYVGSANRYAIGNYMYSTAGPNGDAYNGNVYEVIVYSNVLSTLERQEVEGYLAWKWGFETFTNSPTSIGGLSVWLDGADESTKTLSGTTVTAWQDKASGYSFTAATVASQGGITVTGPSNVVRGGVVFSNATAFNGNGEQALGIYSSPNNSSPLFTIPAQSATLIVASSPTSNDYYRAMAFLGSAQIGASYLPNIDMAVEAGVNAGESIALDYNGSTWGGVFSPASQPTTLAPRIDIAVWAPGTASGFWNNGTNLGVTGSYTSSYSNYPICAFYIGGYTTAVWGNRNFNGTIYEVLFYSNALTTAQRRQVEGYLSKKWSIPITTSLPNSHPFYSIKPCLRTFQPTDIDGCVLWLDSSDKGTVTFSSGSNVASIQDKSYNNYTATSFLNGVSSPVYSDGTIVSGTRGAGSIGLLAGNGFQISSFSLTPTMTAFYISYASGSTSVPTVEWGSNVTSTAGFLIQSAASNYVLNAGITYSNFLLTTFFANTGSIPDRSGPTLAGGTGANWGSMIQSAQALNPINFGNNVGYQPAGAYNYSALTTGFVYSASSGTIQFQGTTDDGLIVNFNGSNVIDQYQQQGATTYYSVSLTLPAGYTPIRITWYDTGGGGQYQIYFSINGGSYINDGTGVFYHLSTASY